MKGGRRGPPAATVNVGTYSTSYGKDYSSEDPESVKVGVGRHLHFWILPLSIKATALLSAHLFILLMTMLKP
jgi:hypothetical protein